jgi:hypothetical protein
MAFQTTVNYSLGAGVIGDRAAETPLIAQTLILNTTDHPERNVIGRAFSFTTGSATTVTAGNPSEDLVYAGILVNAKAYTNVGTTVGGPLASNLALPNNAFGEFATMGTFFVTLGTTATVGNLIVFDNTTGVLEDIAPTATVPSGKSPAYAMVTKANVTAAGLAIIILNPTIIYATA